MANEFKRNVGGKISKDDAMAWIEKYDKEVRKDKAKDTRSVFYGRDVLLKILSDESIAGITFFLGLKHNDAVKKETVQLIMVPTKEDGTHVWADDSAEAKAGAGGGAVAFDGGYQCPPYCG
jgi:hypothetical protein